MAVKWLHGIYVKHNAVFGLGPAGGIQGTPADACIKILKSKRIGPMLKWVNNFCFFCMLSTSILDANGIAQHSYSYNLNMIHAMTHPLGIPWHPVKKKGQNFSSTILYVGFEWNLDTRSVSLPDKKRAKASAKLKHFLADAKTMVLHRDCASLLGMLQHISFVYRDSCAHLSSLCTFSSKFPYDHVCHHVPRLVLEYLHWCQSVLAKPSGSRSLVPCTKLDPDIWVNALMTWGIGIIVGQHWAAWHLAPSCKSEGRDIGWPNP
jgi:hypothetical protein